MLLGYLRTAMIEHQQFTFARCFSRVLEEIHHVLRFQERTLRKNTYFMAKIHVFWNMHIMRRHILICIQIHIWILWPTWKVCVNVHAMHVGAWKICVENMESISLPPLQKSMCKLMNIMRSFLWVETNGVFRTTVVWPHSVQDLKYLKSLWAMKCFGPQKCTIHPTKTGLLGQINVNKPRSVHLDILAIYWDGCSSGFCCTPTWNQLSIESITYPAGQTGSFMGGNRELVNLTTYEDISLNNLNTIFLSFFSGFMIRPS